MSTEKPMFLNVTKALQMMGMSWTEVHEALPLIPLALHLINVYKTSLHSNQPRKTKNHRQASEALPPAA